MVTRVTVRVQAGPFDAAAETHAITQGRADIGAVVTFTGLCRDEGGTLAALELEHYPGMAEEELSAIAEQAAARWPVQAITVIHRFGKLLPGDDIVLVVTASAHRRAAFESADFLIDYLKTRAPFWKKEHRLDGTASGWVAAKDSDEDDASRW